MATFTNQATLTFNGGSVNSNIVTGQLVDVLTGSKTVVSGAYRPGEMLTYVVSLVNTGPSALTGLTVTDNLGAYTATAGELYPLSYVAGSVLYYQNGVLQPAPAVTAGPPLVISGITVPAGGNVSVVYQVLVNEYAPPSEAAEITNTAVVAGAGLAESLTLTETVSARAAYDLSISKALSPAVVTDNETVTYTFVIENTGNTPAIATDNLVITDTFDPVLSNITVSYNGTTWTEPANYTYDGTTGAFATVPGQITVPAATYTQNADGTWTTTPGTQTLVITGTI